MLLAGGALLRGVFFPRHLRPEERPTLEALLDTLLPEGALPSWRATGVMPRLLEELARDRRTRRALVEGVGWLDAESRRRGGDSFTALPPSARDSVVAAAAACAGGTRPRTFYRLVRDRAMRLHHAHPAVWRALGVGNPPQPDGYLDFDDAPRA